jgi:outer membrane lipoprotein-sorting protein
MPVTALLLSALALAAPLAGAQEPDPVRVRAQKIYDALQAKLAKAKSVRAEIEVRNFDRVDKYTLSFLRDNYGKIVSPEAALYQTGKDFFDFNPVDNEYWTRPAPKTGMIAGSAFSLGGLTGLEGIAFPNEPRLVAVRALVKPFRGEKSTALTLEGQKDPSIKVQLYLDVKTGLPLGWEYKLQDFEASGVFKSLKLDVPMKPADFAWTPPRDAKKVG